MKTTVYFAHPYRTIDSEEEKEIIEELKSRNLRIYNPFEKEGKIIEKYGKDSYYDGNPIYWQLARDIWTKDIGAVKRCEILIAWIPSRDCLGTSCEVATAYEYGKFIQIISKLKHPSFAVYADQLFESITEWKKYDEYRWAKYDT